MDNELNCGPKKEQTKNYINKRKFKCAIIFVIILSLILLVNIILLSNTNKSGKQLNGEVYKTINYIGFFEKVFIKYTINGFDSSRSILILNTNKNKFIINQNIELKYQNFPQSIILVQYFKEQIIIEWLYFLLGLILCIVMTVDLLFKIKQREYN